MNLGEFLAMGKYGAFVWPCFLLAGAVLAWNVIAAKRIHAQARQQALRRLETGRGQP
ncbi:MAG: heme exporter protein CcmD [Gammaproteobacteria bacterium]|nr:heme exporter protein CcmD [Gammaproteobacteria bacterium]